MIIILNFKLILQMVRLWTIARKKMRSALIRIDDKVKRMIRDSYKQQRQRKARVSAWK